MCAQIDEATRFQGEIFHQFQLSWTFLPPKHGLGTFAIKAGFCGFPDTGSVPGYQ